MRPQELYMWSGHSPTTMIRPRRSLLTLSRSQHQMYLFFFWRSHMSKSTFFHPFGCHSQGCSCLVRIEWWHTMPHAIWHIASPCAKYSLGLCVDPPNVFACLCSALVNPCRICPPGSKIKTRGSQSRQLLGSWTIPWDIRLESVDVHLVLVFQFDILDILQATADDIWSNAQICF